LKKQSITQNDELNTNHSQGIGIIRIYNSQMR